ncbi:MAG: hypothetical protein P1V51_15430 [Deltaproteobacteria bacterium]|nr:hypothetical protein [Deltaproteobacteria bacterium]
MLLLRWKVPTQSGRKSERAPSQWLLFPRVTLVGSRSVERVTLDLGLTVQTERSRIDIPELVIAELKQPRFGPRTPGMRAIRACRIHPGGFSKYCAAVSLSGEEPRAYRTPTRVREIMRSHHAR